MDEFFNTCRHGLPEGECVFCDLEYIDEIIEDDDRGSGNSKQV